MKMKKCPSLQKPKYFKFSLYKKLYTSKTLPNHELKLKPQNAKALLVS